MSEPIMRKLKKHLKKQAKEIVAYAEEEYGKTDKEKVILAEINKEYKNLSKAKLDKARQRIYKRIDTLWNDLDIN